MWIYNSVSAVWHRIRAGTMTQCGNYDLPVSAASTTKPVAVALPARVCAGCATSDAMSRRVAETNPIFAARLARLHKEAAERYSEFPDQAGVLRQPSAEHG